jgi:endonuclease YncB( thermonuclease family)
MKRVLLAILILAFPYLVSQPIHAGQYKVVRVTDGDTIKVRAPGSRSDITIRLVGIDAPET